MRITSVDVDLDEVLVNSPDSYLIDYIETRGYTVVEDIKDQYELTEDEMSTLIDMVINYKPGTIEHSIYEKLRKR